MIHTLNKNNLAIPNNIVSLHQQVELLRKGQLNSIEQLNELIDKFNDLTNGNGELNVKNLTADEINIQKGTVENVDETNEKSIPNVKFVNDAVAAGGDPSQTLTLTNEELSLITYGNINVGEGTPNIIIDKDGSITAQDVITNNILIQNGIIETVGEDEKSIVNKKYINNNVENIVNDVLSSGVETLNATGDITGQNITASNELKGKTLNINDTLTINENGYITGGKVNQNEFNDYDIINKKYVDDNVEIIVNDVLSSGSIQTIQTQTLTSNTVETQTLETQTMETKEITIKDENDNDKIILDGETGNITASGELIGSALKIKKNNDIMLNIDNDGYITGGKINNNDIVNENDIVNKNYVDDLIYDINEKIEDLPEDLSKIVLLDKNNEGNLTLTGEDKGNITSNKLNTNSININQDNLIIDNQGNLISKGNLTGETLNGKSLVINTDKAYIDNQGNLSINKGIINEIDLNNKKSIIDINYFDNNKGYYFVNSIVNTIEGQTDDLIFVINDNNDLTLYKKNDDEYEIYNVNDGSLCIVNDDEEVYVKYKDENKQKWEKINENTNIDKYNYFVYDIYDTKPQEAPYPEYILYNNYDILELQKYNDNIQDKYEKISILQGALCINNNNHSLYINYGTGLNHNWIKLNIEPPTQQEYHYNLNNLSLNEPLDNKPEYILLKNNDNYIFKRLINNEYVNFDEPPYGTIININDTNDIYIKYKNLNNLNDKQHWIKESKYNYYVSDILDTEPTENKPEYIFIRNDDNYILKHLYNDIYYPLNSININSNCLIINTLETFTLISNNPQRWGKTNEIKKLNYLVDKIYDTKPQEEPYPEYILLNDNNILKLEKFNGTDDYNEIDVINGTLCIVNNKEIYIKEDIWTKAFNKDLIDKYNYTVEQIYNEKPQEEPYPEYILLNTNNILELYKFDGTNDYIIEDAPLSSLCIVNDIEKLYVRFEDKDNKQNWILINNELDRYNYIVDEILTKEPQTQQLNDIIFIRVNDKLYLKKSNGTIFETLDVKEGLLCFVKNDNEIYIKENNEWIKSLHNYNIIQYNTPHIYTNEDIGYLTDYILYTENDINYVLKKWENGEYIQEDNVNYGTYIYIENDKEIYVKEKDFDNLLNQQNWIKHENINNLSHLNIYGPVKIINTTNPTYSIKYAINNNNEEAELTNMITYNDYLYLINTSTSVNPPFTKLYKLKISNDNSTYEIIKTIDLHYSNETNNSKFLLYIYNNKLFVIYQYEQQYNSKIEIIYDLMNDIIYEPNTSKFQINSLIYSLLTINNKLFGFVFDNFNVCLKKIEIEYDNVYNKFNVNQIEFNEDYGKIIYNNELTHNIKYNTYYINNFIYSINQEDLNIYTITNDKIDTNNYYDNSKIYLCLIPYNNNVYCITKNQNQYELIIYDINTFDPNEGPNKTIINLNNFNYTNNSLCILYYNIGYLYCYQSSSSLSIIYSINLNNNYEVIQENILNKYTEGTTNISSSTYDNINHNLYLYIINKYDNIITKDICIFTNNDLYLNTDYTNFYNNVIITNNQTTFLNGFNLQENPNPEEDIY